MARSLAVALAVVCCLATAHAQLTYTGPESFVNSFESVGNLLELDGATAKLVTAGEVYGINVAGLSAARITLKPCTILQPHTHPHSEFAYTTKGKVVHSTPYNNLTLFTLSPNTAEAGKAGFALFPASQLHVTYNEGCEDAEFISVFGTPYPSINFFPYAQSLLPEAVTSSYFNGDLSNENLAEPVGTAKLEGCSCKGRDRKLM